MTDQRPQRAPIVFDTARTAPRATECLGVPVYTEGTVPRSLGLNRAALARLGFEGKLGQTLALPGADGTLTVAVGMGESGALTAAGLRTAAAALARAASKRASVATPLADVPSVDARSAGQAVAEGFALASYKFVEFKSDKTAPALERVTLVADPAKSRLLLAGAERGALVAAAVNRARDLVNTPGGSLNARDLADHAVAVAGASGLECEVLDERAMAELGLGGLLAVNRGSAEPPRLVKLTYSPRNAASTVALVGKGITFDSGGLSIKPTDGMLTMKSDMSGAAVVLAAMSTLKALRVKTRVIGYLCCTDNMTGGAALKLGDVIRYRGGRTVEIHNTDAEGRLVLADGLGLAVEAGADAIVDVATLTGACMVALGRRIAGLMGNHDDWVAQVQAASARADEPTWRLPLPAEYRKLLDSDVADLKNIGGPYGGAITAGLFLQEFVGSTPWAHLDIAGPSWAESDEGITPKGGTAFGVRTLIELLDHYRPPAS